MGAAIAYLLTSHNYTVISNISGRSQATHDRASAAGVQLVMSDVELCQRADYILSIVPPIDALSTAQRVVAASAGARKIYIDLNAVAPSTARTISQSFEGTSIISVDGGILGSPPSQSSDGQWAKPRLVVSGPYDISTDPQGALLASLLNLRHIAPTIGPASGLKMCFASLTKGFTALAIQSLTTASRLGILEEFKAELHPVQRDRAFGGVKFMQSKAYRWAPEMDEIAKTFGEEGGFDGKLEIFDAIGEVYKLVAADEVLGRVSDEGIRATNEDPDQTVRELAGAMDRRHRTTKGEIE